MSHGTVSDTRFRLEAFNGIFALRPKIDFSQRGRSRVFGQK